MYLVGNNRAQGVPLCASILSIVVVLVVVVVTIATCGDTRSRRNFPVQRDICAPPATNHGGVMKTVDPSVFKLSWTMDTKVNSYGRYLVAPPPPNQSKQRSSFQLHAAESLRDLPGPKAGLDSLHHTNNTHGQHHQQHSMSGQRIGADHAVRLCARALN